MDSDQDWQARFKAGDEHAEKQLEKLASGNSVNRDFYRSALMAMRSARLEGLHPVRDKYGEFIYTQEQGIKAACQGREDAAATLMIQFAVLQRLQFLKVAAWIGLVLLAYIAFRVS